MSEVYLKRSRRNRDSHFTEYCLVSYDNVEILTTSLNISPIFSNKIIEKKQE